MNIIVRIYRVFLILDGSPLQVFKININLDWRYGLTMTLEDRKIAESDTRREEAGI